MAMIDVTFKLAKSDGSEASIVFGPSGEKFHLEFGADGRCTTQLNGKRDYPFDWEFIGKNGDTLSVTWSGAGDEGSLISAFSIDKDLPDTRPWPGGNWKSIGKSTFVRIEP